MIYCIGKDGRVLVGNCLSLAKSFGQHVHCRLAAETPGLRSRNCRLKGVPMIGFLGTFRINFLIPAWLGIGKSVSRGFGTVEPAACGKEDPC
jgi:Cas6b C-terminal domain